MPVAARVVSLTQTPSEKDRILRNLPEGTYRVQIQDKVGRSKFKKPDEIVLTDRIILNQAGQPVVMRGRPGRPPRVELTPANDQVGDVMEARNDHIDASPLVTAVHTDAESDEVMDHVMRAFAEEISVLEFERKEAERTGEGSVASASVKRARALKAMADTWLKRKEKIEQAMLDLDSKAFEVLFAFMLETLRSAMEDAGLRSEHIETVFNKLSKRLGDGWKEEARAKMREAR
jgi:hypothetical protein